MLAEPLLSLLFDILFYFLIGNINFAGDNALLKLIDDDFVSCLFAKTGVVYTLCFDCVTKAIKCHVVAFCQSFKHAI